MTIRKVRINEMHKLRDFAERTFRDAFESANDPVFFKQYCDEAFSIEQIVAELTYPQSEFFFALFDGEAEPAAYLKINYDQHAEKLDSRNTIQIERLYVLPKYQGQRIGEKMLLLAEERARKVGADYLWLGVWQENPAALRFYERNGFEKFDTHVFPVGDDPQTDWLMKKNVAYPLKISFSDPK